ncbi:DUF6412 domain-containing protein [Agromyces rhizosphaerae]|nr:DUF6412 domain-containing protein [Agromyces rhizosphaerae]
MAVAVAILARFVALAADVVAAAADGLAVAGSQGLLLVVVSLVAVAALVAVLRAPIRAVADASAVVYRGQTVDVSFLLAQCDPDAAGSVRPRAPGGGSTAA